MVSLALSWRGEEYIFVALAQSLTLSLSLYNFLIIYIYFLPCVSICLTYRRSPQDNGLSKFFPEEKEKVSRPRGWPGDTQSSLAAKSTITRIHRGSIYMTPLQPAGWHTATCS